MSDLFSRIKTEVPPTNYDLTTAEGRAQWDNALRAFINQVEDNSVRAHLGQMVKEWRWEYLRPKQSELYEAGEKSPADCDSRRGK